MKQTITIFIILGAGILLLALIQSMSTSGVVEQASQVVDIADKPNARIEGGTRVVPATELRVTNQTSNTIARTDMQVEIEPVINAPAPKPAPAPVVKPKLLQGSFSGSGSYNASGSVFVSGQDISLVNLSSSRVPDGRIYLSNSRDGTGRVDLGALRGSSGDYNFRAPTGIDPSDYKYVLIWCRAFSSLVGIAEIR